MLYVDHDGSVRCGVCGERMDPDQHKEDNA